MAYQVPDTRTPPRNAFWRAFFQTLGGAGNVYVRYRPTRYPQDAHHRNLIRIGKYMREAMERYDDQITKEEALEAHPSTPDS